MNNLIARYSNLAQRFGVDSDQAKEFEREHKDNISLTHRIRDLKRLFRHQRRKQ